MEEVRISLVIPCFNEEKVLRNSVQKCEEALQFADSYEIIIVEDGCTDKTPDIASELADENKDIRHFHSDDGMGKGGAIEKGFELSIYEVKGFIDADLSPDIAAIERMVSKLENNDIVISSRFKNTETDRKISREIPSRGFNWLVRRKLDSSFLDHQCGFKIFRGDFTEVFSHVENKGWFWDTEVLVRASMRNYSVVEVPVAWEEKGDSDVSVLREGYRFWSEINRLKDQLEREKS